MTNTTVVATVVVSASEPLEHSEERRSVPLRSSVNGCSVAKAPSGVSLGVAVAVGEGLGELVGVGLAVVGLGLGAGVADVTVGVGLGVRRGAETPPPPAF
jgi:hypothetical protein